MMIANIQGRRTGKTEAFIRFMRANPDALGIVSNNKMKSYYPDDIRVRLVTAEDFIKDNSTRTYKKIGVDEPFLISSLKIAQLFFFLGQSYADIEIFGTTKEDHSYENYNMRPTQEPRWITRISQEERYD